MDTEHNLPKCTVCNSRLYEDGTAENCTGECGIEIHHVENKYQPLDFNDNDEVIRELPEFEDELDDFVEGEDERLRDEGD